jgi:hypothetical protein
MAPRLLRWLALAALGAGITAAWCLAVLRAALAWAGPTALSPGRPGRGVRGTPWPATAGKS